MISLFNSGSKYQKIARQHNCNLVESNGYWLLYKDGELVARDQHPRDAIQLITHRL
jgi:hypothetical protein